jgi:hypothetical protein
MVITNERSHPRLVIGKVLKDRAGKHHREFILETLGNRALFVFIGTPEAMSLIYAERVKSRA